MTNTDPHIIANRIAQRFLAGQPRENSYANQLSFEAIFIWDKNFPSFQDEIHASFASLNIDERSILRWQDQQFHDCVSPYFLHKNSNYTKAFLQCTDNWINEAARRKNQLIIHNCKHHPVGSLIDMHQAYVLRLSRAAVLCAADPEKAEKYLHEITLQESSLRDELRNTNHGCYHQGKGWLPNDGLSPSCWSRGQGWLLHGWVHCLNILQAGFSEHQAFTCLHQNCRDLLDELVPLQKLSGMWHQLVNESENAFPDTSGTAFICEALNRYQLLFGTKETYQKSANLAWSALCNSVDNDGLVRGVCKGPGPIWEAEPWRVNAAVDGDPHGIFTMLFACSAQRDFDLRFSHA